MRVNARLDESSSRKLDYLVRETGWSVSEVLRKAVDAYHRRFLVEKGDPLAALERSGFIGCSEGRPELSRTYKNELRGLARKHGHR